MSDQKTRLIDDLAAFADLGTDPPVLVDLGGNYAVRFTRNGTPLTLTFDTSGQVVERRDSEERKYASLRSLLSSLF